MAVFRGYTLTAPASCCVIKLFGDMEGRDVSASLGSPRLPC